MCEFIKKYFDVIVHIIFLQILKSKISRIELIVQFICQYIGSVPHYRLGAVPEACCTVCIRGWTIPLPGICMGFFKMLLFFSLAVFSGSWVFFVSAAAPSAAWFCDSPHVASHCGCTTLSPLFSNACCRDRKHNRTENAAG